MIKKLRASIVLIFFTGILISQENAPNPSDTKNWVSNIGYDLDGNTVSKGVSYFNTLGKSTQSQSWDVLTSKVWTSQTLYDYQGRPAFQSLSAPTDGVFGYLNGFIKNSSGINYSTLDFDTSSTKLSPYEVSNQSNTLGWYYSNNNTSELYQDITSYPFSRTIYSKLNPGVALKTLGGNKVTINGTEQWANGYSFSMPVSQELHYAFGKDRFPSKNIAETSCITPQPSGGVHQYYAYDLISVDVENGCSLQSGVTFTNVGLHPYDQEYVTGQIYKIQGDELWGYYEIENSFNAGNTSNYSSEGDVICGGYTSCSQLYNPVDYIKATKTISRDVHGIETVVFTDSDGNTLAAARSGNEDGKAPLPYDVLSTIGEQGFVDIHIPVGCGGNIIFEGASSASFNIFNLVTEEKLNTSAITASTYFLNPGMYRIEETTTFHKNPLPYVKISGSTINLIDDTNQVGVSYKVNYYDYSLNFYDKARRLTQSVQPEGFDDTLNLTTSTRNHALTSTYSYNTLGQLLDTSSPDEGTAEFKYRKDGQIRFSQNILQASNNEFSYTNYDNLGRPVESGVLQSTAFASADPDSNTLPSGTTKEQHFTEYDISDTNLSSLLTTEGIPSNNYKQQFVAGNVSKTFSSNPSTTTTWYSYDIYGRVTWLIQNIDGLGFKTIDYEYDFAQGNVTKVIYQKNNSSELFVHKYNYNIAGQLLSVYISTDNSTFTEQESYEYFETGALKRKELLGGMQGTDYIYNINGQLKAINHPSLSSAQDPGGDTDDAFGMTLDYYTGDYKRNTDFSSVTSGTDQFNGNIKGATWNTRISSTITEPFEYTYQYNKNNWLTEANFNANGNTQPNIPSDVVLSSIITVPTHVEATNSITLTAGFEVTNNFTAKIVAPSSTSFNSDDYKVHNITYDANGNIKTLERNKNTEDDSNAMDNFTYNYKTGKNQLDHVQDAVTLATNADDLKSQSSGNYTYNSIGQLTQSNENGNTINYTYSASGLVREIKKNNLPLVRFYYNDKGHRVSKEIYNNSGNLTDTDYYVRDASGSVMAIYRNSNLTEQPIYGNSRIGVYKRQDNSTMYQLTDHLGNVRAVIGKDSNGSALMLSHTDYYPGGMPMPNRNVEGDYRYKFQGQEKDPETGMEAFELRLYDSRINRWISPDPYGQYYSPYMAMGNDWINGIDPDGGCYIKNEDGSYSKCPEESVGSTRTGAFGYNWTSTKNDGWQVTNGASGTIETSYAPVLANGNADYYIKRYASHLERYNSKPPDYYLSYGHKYINRFTNQTRPKLSDAGKEWLDRTAINLQYLMNKGLRNSNGSIALDNDKFGGFAYDTHVPAYVGSGLLSLGIMDKVKIGLTPDFGDLFTTDGLRQANDVLSLQYLNWNNMFPDFEGGIKSESNCGCTN